MHTIITFFLIISNFNFSYATSNTTAPTPTTLQKIYSNLARDCSTGDPYGYKNKCLLERLKFLGFKYSGPDLSTRDGYIHGYYREVKDSWNETTSTLTLKGGKSCFKNWGPRTIEIQFLCTEEGLEYAYEPKYKPPTVHGSTSLVDQPSACFYKMDFFVNADLYDGLCKKPRYNSIDLDYVDDTGVKECSCSSLPIFLAEEMGISKFKQRKIVRKLKFALDENVIYAVEEFRKIISYFGIVFDNHLVLDKIHVGVNHFFKGLAEQVNRSIKKRLNEIFMENYNSYYNNTRFSFFLWESVDHFFQDLRELLKNIKYDNEINQEITNLVAHYSGLGDCVSCVPYSKFFHPHPIPEPKFRSYIVKMIDGVERDVLDWLFELFKRNPILNKTPIEVLRTFKPIFRDIVDPFIEFLDRFV